MEKNTKAGLTYAPPYDPSQEIDPSAVESIPVPQVIKREDFEYFRKNIEKRAVLGRTIIYTIIIVLLGANLWSIRSNKLDIIQNINETRLHQSAFEDGVQAELVAIKTKLEALKSAPLAEKTPELDLTEAASVAE